MPVIYKSSATSDHTWGRQVTQTAVAKPATVADGDFLLAAVGTRSSTATITPPDDWTLIQRVSNEDSAASPPTPTSLALYYKFASREPDRWTWAFSVAGYHSTAVAAYAGVDWFYPIDANNALTTGTSAAPTTQPALPSVVTSERLCVLAGAVGVYNTNLITAPTGYQRRAYDDKYQVSIAIADAPQPAAGASTAATWLIGAATICCTALVALRPATNSVTTDEARSLLKSLFPPGAENLYDWDNTDANVYKQLTAVADVLKAYGYDYVDLLSREFNPAKVAVKLPDWEQALGITVNTASVVNAWVATRRSAIVSKLRESGACTADNVRSIVEPLLGYSGSNLGTLRIVECDRANLKALHTYRPTTLDGVVPVGGSVTNTIVVPDDGAVSVAGVQLFLRLAITTDASDLRVILTGPTQTTWSGGPTAAASVTWAAGEMPFVQNTEHYVLFDDSNSPGKFIRGTWTVQVTDMAGFLGGTILDMGLFVEGAGRDALGNDGLGAAIYHWGIWADPQKYDALVADFEGVRKAIARIKPAHTNGNIIRSSTTIALGSFCAIPGDALCIPGQCIPSGSMWTGWTNGGGNGADGGALVDVLGSRHRSLPTSDLTQFAYVRVP